MGNTQKTPEMTNDLIYLLCPGCFTRVPIINIVFDNCVPKIKLTCTCEESKSRPNIMDISDYINKMRYRDPLLLKCEKHLDNSPVTFCLNCEKWYCEECLSSGGHNKNNCNPIEDDTTELCSKHLDSKKTSICKKCSQAFCDKCADAHIQFWEKQARDSIDSGKKHRIIKFDSYLSKEKMEKKISKFKVFKTEVMKILYDKYNELITEIKDKKEKEPDLVPKGIEDKVKEAYTQNKEINENLIELTQILFNNIEYQLLLPITNKKLLINVILNTSFNTDDISTEGKSIKEKAEYLINIYHTYYLNKTLYYQMSKKQTIEGKESINLLFSLNEYKFATVEETIIQIWNGDSLQKLGSLIGHTNRVQGMCKIKEEELASSSCDKSIKIWNIITFQCLKTININGMPGFLFHNKINQNEIAFLNFGKTVEVWDMNTQEQIKTVSFKDNIWFENYYQLKNGKVFFGNGNGFIVLNENTFELSEEIKDLKNDPNMFSEVNNKIAIGLKSGDIIIYDSNLSNPINLFGHTNAITGIVLLSDNMILSSSLDTQMKIWNLHTLECEETFIMNKYEITNMIKLNNDKVATLNEHGVDIWKYESFI